jgi:GntR family transcriptional regulator
MNIHLQPTSVPAYVEIYNSLFSDIVNGVYPQGECMPGEIALAQKYNVSRNTLRQAMAILTEDGLLIRSRGKGTLVVGRTDEQKSAGTDNPMTTFAQADIDKTDIQYNFTAPTDIAQAKLALSKSDVLLASYLVYQSGDTVIGYSFVQVPVKLLSYMQVDVSSADAMHRFLSEALYSAASYQTISFKLIFVNETETEFLQVEEGTPVHLLECILYGADATPLARCKHYMRPEYYKISYTVRM